MFGINWEEKADTTEAFGFWGMYIGTNSHYSYLYTYIKGCWEGTHTNPLAANNLP